MLGDDEDVFDSVTWESPAAHNYPESGVSSSGPGFRQSTVDSEDASPHDPKWEGFLLASVKDPVKELAETKDAYVSYLVSAKVGLVITSPPYPLYVCGVDQLAHILCPEPLSSPKISGFCLSTRASGEGLPGLCGPGSPR